MAKVRPLAAVSPKKFNPKTLPKLAAKASAVPVDAKPIPTRVNNRKRSVGNRAF